MHPPWIKACACIGTPRFREYLHIKRWRPVSGRHGFYLMTPQNRESWSNVSRPRWSFQRGSPFWRPFNTWWDKTFHHENSRGRQFGASFIYNGEHFVHRIFLLHLAYWNCIRAVLCVIHPPQIYAGGCSFKKIFFESSCFLLTNLKYLI